ncbi:MAG TPA: HEAT repeat domain-containing protein [Anaerolineales bacterium]|nr:HEAT repeat domain-containing protein [Anaerolineales bacterium]
MMNTTSTSFQTVLDALLSERKDFPRRYLQEFSDIGALELKTLLDVWPKVRPGRKLTLLEELDALAEADTLVCFDDFARSLLTDPDPEVRTRAIRLLDEYEDPKIVPSYLDMLRNDPDINVRVEAANALNLFVDLGELEKISDSVYHQIEDALLASAASEDDVRVRRTALESLGYSSRPEVSTLIESAFHRQDPNWQASALVAMGRSADERWDEHVTRSLVHVDDRIRKAAVVAAGELSLQLARPILLKMLGEEEEATILSAVIWSLSQIGGEDVRTYLENILDQLEDDDEEQIAFLEEALDNLSFTEDLDRFDLLAIDPDDELLELEEDDEEEK